MSDEQDAVGVPDSPVVETAPPIEIGWADQQVEDVAPVEPAESTSPTNAYTVKVGGEEITVSLDEALAGYQRQADYTRKTQELAEQRTELDYAARLAMALETDPQRAIQALQEAYSVQQPPAAPTTPSEPLDPDEAWRQQVDARFAAQEQAAYEAQITTQLAGLHQQFGQFDDVELVNFAVNHGIPDLADAAKVFVFDKTFTKIAADRNATAAKQAAPPVAGGHGVAGGAVTQGAAETKPDIRSALLSAFAAHGVPLT